MVARSPADLVGASRRPLPPMVLTHLRNHPAPVSQRSSRDSSESHRCVSSACRYPFCQRTRRKPLSDSPTSLGGGASSGPGTLLDESVPPTLPGSKGGPEGTPRAARGRQCFTRPAAAKSWRNTRTHLPRKPDVVFHVPKQWLFVHGCFWPGCSRAVSLIYPCPGCAHVRRAPVRSQRGRSTATLDPSEHNKSQPRRRGCVSPSCR
jgi:DNA mismatch endonuclease Vsr